MQGPTGGVRASVGMKKAEEEMDRRGKLLTAYDFHHDSFVFVSHEDGSSFQFRNAFYEKWVDENNQEWLFVFAEHFYPMCFAIDDLNHYYAAKAKFPPVPPYEEDEEAKDKEQRLKTLDELTRLSQEYGGYDF